MSRTRHRVVLRPKVRGRRLRLAALLAFVAVLGAGALLTARQLGREFAPSLSWDALRSALAPRVDSVELFGAPEVLRAPMLAVLSGAPGGASAKAEALRRAFPCVREARARRGWFKRAARFDVSVHQALARAARRGRPAGFLAEDGSLFAAPEDAYPAVPVAVEVASAGEPELKSLARCLAAIGRSKNLLSALERMRYLSAQDGWEAGFADGTRALWGELSWTDEKLARLREVVLDARDRFEGGLTADLRYFEDGKVLVRPAKFGMR